MRRFKQLLPDNETRQILTDSTNGILSLSGIDGVPYGVPLSFCYDGARTIYFHCARNGRKIDCIMNNGNASFCVVAQDAVQPEEFTTYFKSAIAAGKISVVDSEDERIYALRLLAAKYSPGIDPSKEIAGQIGNVAVLRFDIESLTGKEAIELTRNRR